MTTVVTTKEETLQHPSIYSAKLPRQEEIQGDRVGFLEEVRTKLSAAVLENDIDACAKWTINLHKYIICYGYSFTRSDNIIEIQQPS